MADEGRVLIDSELSTHLAEVGGRWAGDVAGAVIDVRLDPKVRYGFLGASSLDRVFEIGSVTKGLTGMLLADAISRGEVELGTTVAAIQPAVEGTPLGAVTLRQLATHASGLPRLAGGAKTTWRGLRFAYLGLDPYRGLTPDDVFSDAARQRLDRPGQYLYSNLGGALCGQLIARAARCGDFAGLLHHRILVPAGLTHTSVGGRGQAAPAGRSPLGFRRQPWVMDGYAPAGGVRSTIADMARLAVGLLTATGPGCESLNAIDGAKSDGGDRPRGMFWIIQRTPVSGLRMIWHNGRTGGYSAFFALLPDRGQAIVVLSSVAQSSRTERLAAALMRSLGEP